MFKDSITLPLLPKYIIISIKEEIEGGIIETYTYG